MLWNPTCELCVLDCDDAELTVMGTVESGAEATENARRRHLAVAVTFDSAGAVASILAQTVACMKDRNQFDKPIASF